MFSLDQPGVQIHASPFCEHHHEPLAQLVGHLQIKMRLSDLLNRLLLFLIKLLWLTDEEPGCARPGHAAFYAGFGRQRRRNFERVPGIIERQD